MSKTVNIQIVDIEGKVIKEDTIMLKEGSTLVFRIPKSLEHKVDEIFEVAKSVGSAQSIIIPEDVEIKVITVE